jgi:hypothetical protein
MKVNLVILHVPSVPNRVKSNFYVIGAFVCVSVSH